MVAGDCICCFVVLCNVYRTWMIEEGGWIFQSHHKREEGERRGWGRATKGRANFYMPESTPLDTM